MNRLILLLITSLFLTLISCQQSPEAQILEIANAAELGTVEYTVKKIVKTNDSKWYTIGDRKVVFSVTAYLKAGINLSQMTSDNIQINNSTKSVTLTIPHATLLSFNMPIEDVIVEYQQVGYLRSDFSSEERNAILAQGEKSIKNDKKIMDGIINDAEDNASLFFKNALSSIGFNDVKVVFE